MQHLFAKLVTMMTEQRVELKPENNKVPVRLIVFDMDNTLLMGRFVDTSAERFGFVQELEKLRTSDKEPGTLTKHIARLFKGISLSDLHVAADSIPLVEDAASIIRSLKRKGHIIGIISDSYQFVVNAIVKKLNADFGIGNALEFLEGRATGNVTIPSSYYYHPASACKHALCKTNVLTHLMSDYKISLQNCVAIGDSENDLCMIKNAGTGIAFCPTYAGLKPVADKVIDKRSFESLLSML